MKENNQNGILLSRVCIVFFALVLLAVDVCENCGTGGREPRHRLKESVGDGIDSAVEKEGKHPKDGKKHPTENDDDVRVFCIQGGEVFAAALSFAFVAACRQQYEAENSSYHR